MGTSTLRGSIQGLEARLDGPTRDELAHIRRDLEGGDRTPVIELPNLRLGFACKQRWEDMVGDDRVRACGGCDRPVFNLSAMTRAEGERLLASRGLTPCVRFYRRPDGTVMTTDCPSGELRERRRLAIVAGSLAAGAALAAPSAAHADRTTPPTDSTDSTTTAVETDVTTVTPGPSRVIIVLDQPAMGIPEGPRGLQDLAHEEVGIIIEPRPSRPPIAWSLWGRLGSGLRSRPPALLARTRSPSSSTSSSPTWEAALAADVTFGVGLDGDLRLGAFAEVRTSSSPVLGGELVVSGLPPHPWSSRIAGTGSLVLRAGGNADVVTAAVGFGYVGSFPRSDPWLPWADHLVGARLVASVNRSRDDRAWSATLGIEVEPLGALRAVFDILTE